MLDQNVPNPFTESTVIHYNLPGGFKKAELVISNSNGEVVKTISLSGIAQNSITVYGSDISHGIYSYALIVDGRTLETRKMIRE